MIKHLALTFCALLLGFASFAIPIINGPSTVCVGNTATYSDTTTGGTWSLGGSIATIGSATGILNAYSAGTTTITYTVAGSGTVYKTITINPNPAAITGPTILFPGGSGTYTDVTAGGAWASSNPAILTISVSGLATAVSCGTDNIMYTLTTGCSVSFTDTVACLGSSTYYLTGASSLCVGSSITLTDSTPGGHYTSGNTSIATVGLTSGVVTGVAAGATTITYLLGGTYQYKNITVNPLPAAISGATTVGVGSNITLTDATGGGAWSSSYTSRATVTSGGVVNGVSAGAVTITYALTTGCFVTHADTVTGGGSMAIGGTFHVCAGSYTYLTDSTSGGTWSSSNLSIATVGTSTGLVTGIAAGVCTITYTVGTSTSTVSFTVNPAPAAIGGPGTVAAGSSITETDATSGGTWSSSNVTVATVGVTTGLVTGVASGYVYISYTLPAGCSVSKLDTVTGSGSMAIGGTLHVCVGSTTYLSDSTTGGTWSSSNTAIATVGSVTGLVTGVSAGVCTITYTHGTSTATVSFTVNPVPGAIAGGSTVAVGSSITLTDGTTGGAWSSSNTSVATVTSGGLVTGVTGGTVTITYMLTTGCYVTHTVTVTGTSINPITGSGSVCLGSTIALMDSTSGGTWSSSNTAIATVSTAGVVTGVSTGTCTITYTVGTSYVTKPITVNPLPATPTGPTTVAAGSMITLSDGTGGGMWSSGNTSIATVGASTGIVTGVSAGTVWIYYSLTTGCANHISITVTGGTSILPITGTLHACIGTTTTLHDSTSGGSWSSSNTAIATVGASTGVVTGVSAGTCTITYTVGTSYVTASVTVSAAPGAITGPTTVAAGGTITLADITAGGTWSSSNTSVATVGVSTGVVTGVSAGTVTIYYTIPGGCSVAYTITVTGTGTIWPITGTFSVCAGSSSTLYDSTSGGTYSSSNTAIATVTTSTGVVTGISAGTCTITYTVGTSYVTHSFTVSAVPSAISGPTTVSAGSSITLTDATPGGTWVSGNTSIATVSSTGVVTGVTGGTVNIYYTTTGGCAVYYTITVSGTLSGIGGTPHTCVGNTTTLTDSASGGTWSSSNTAIATVVASTGIVSGIAAGTCTISYTYGTSVVTISFTVYTAPAAITGGSTMCIGGTLALSDATTGGTWSSSSTYTATVVSTTGVVTGVHAGAVNIYYVMTTGCGVAKTVTVYPTPAPISGSSTVCVGTTITLADTTSGGTWMSVYTAYATVGSTTGVVTGVSVGTTTITYSIGGCSVSKTVTVTTAPAAIVGASSVCVGSAITLTDASPGGAWTSGLTADATVSTAGAVTGVAAGVVNIYYTVGSCSVYHTVTVNPQPSVISGSSTVHTGGSPITLTDGVGGGSWFSGNTSLATVGATSGVVTGVSAGTVNIYYSIGGCAVYKTITVISPAPPGPGGSITNGNAETEIDPAMATQSGNIDFAGAKTTAPGSVSGLTPDNSLKMYPNPTSGILNIQWENQVTGNATVTVSDIVGHEVLNSIITLGTDSGTTQLDMSNLKAGIYILSIKSESNSFTSRLIIQR